MQFETVTKHIEETWYVCPGCGMLKQYESDAQRCWDRHSRKVVKNAQPGDLVQYEYVGTYNDWGHTYSGTSRAWGTVVKREVRSSNGLPGVLKFLIAREDGSRLWRPVWMITDMEVPS